MATTVASLRILLGLDSKDVRDGAGSVKSELKGIQAEAKKTQSTFDEIKRGIGQGLGIGAGLGGFQVASQGVSQFVGFLNDAVKSAQEDEQSVAQLTAAIKANVPAWTGATEAIEKQINAAQRLGFTDDEVRESLQRLVAVTHDVNEAVKIQQTAVDLARFKNIDLASATQALVTVEAGRYRGLAALGINIKDIHNQTEALAAVQKVASGAAEAWGNTSAGAAKEAGIAFDEAQEAIGKRLLPVVTELSHGMRDVVAPAVMVVADNLNTILPVVTAVGLALTTQFAVGLASSAAAAVGLGTAMTVLPASVLEAGAAFTIAGTASEGLAVGINSVGLAAKGAIPLIGLFVIALEGINKPAVSQFVDDFHEKLRSFKDDLPPTAEEAAKLAAGEKVLTDAGYNLDGSLDESTRNLRLIGQAYDATHQPIEKATDSTVLFGVALNSAGLTVLAANAGVQAASSTFVEFGAASIDSAAGLTTLAANLGTAADAAAGAEGQVSDLQRALDLLPSDVQIRIRVTTQAEGAGGRNVAEKIGTATDIATGAGDPGRAQANADFLRDQKARDDAFARDRKAAADRAAADAKRDRDRAASDAKSARDRAAADAKRAADELSRAQVASANDAFTRMADAAHRYFDDLHKANMKAIDDAQKVADEQIEAQKRANLQPATAAEARLRAVQQARQLAGLQADFAAAKTPEERLRAQQALSDFQAQARIDFMRRTADTANQILDDQKKVTDQGFADQRDKENERSRQQVSLFDEDLKALREYIGKHPAEWKKATDKVTAVLKAAGVDYEKAGVDNANAYIRGVNKAFAGFGAPAAPAGAKGAAAATTPSPAIAATAGLVYVGGGAKGDVYLDGNKVGEFIERYLAANASATTSGYTARHN